MKIAFAIFKYFPGGGFQCDMMRIARELAKRGHDLTIFCHAWDGKRPEDIRITEVEVSGWSNHRRAQDFADIFRGELRRGKFDVSVAFNRFGGTDFYFAADNPFYLTAIRNVGRLGSLLLPRYRSFIRQEREVFSPESRTRIFCITPYQMKAYRHIYNTQRKRCILLPPGISPDHRRPEENEAAARRLRLRDSLGLRPEEVMLLSVGSGFRTKGVDRSIAALASLPRDYMANTRLFIAGRGKEAPYRTLARRLGVDDRVTFLGERNDISDLMLGADLLIHPARNEAAGSVLIEALAAGTPVLCTGNCGFADQVEAAHQVVLHMPFRQRELNRALLLQFCTPDRLDELKREAAAYGSCADFYRRHIVAADIITGVPDK